jgi:hypothetical protein
MPTTATTIDLQQVQAEIRRMAAGHRALLDELENRIRALDTEIARARATQGWPYDATRRACAPFTATSGRLGRAAEDLCIGRPPALSTSDFRAV